jgi:cyclopropane-fatty-acyl-phospholipid synthase
MEGWWECDRLDEFFCRLLPTRPEEKLRKNWRLLYYLFEWIILNPGKRGNAFYIGKKHYDIGNELYKKMLDKKMVYSCAYWKDAQTLDDAQEAKLDLICRKLGFRAGDRILDIGCGWGSLLRYAAERYGITGVGITVSGRQAQLARENCRGLAVEIRLQDYRDLNEKFDHVVSVGMFEHVGCKNYRSYMQIARKCLKDGGLFLLHTIGNNRSEVTGDLWMDTYIFPNSMLPSLAQIGASAEGLFVLEDLHSFGPYYDTTLGVWLNNFEKSWHELKESYDERFYRMWKYYLQVFAGAFRSRFLNVWQIVFSGKGVPGGYVAIR